MSILIAVQTDYGEPTASNPKGIGSSFLGVTEAGA
jgi:hypothetical protein